MRLVERAGDEQGVLGEGKREDNAKSYMIMIACINK
jgi:hypothetical protein